MGSAGRLVPGNVQDEKNQAVFIQGFSKRTGNDSLQAISVPAVDPASCAGTKPTARSAKRKNPTPREKGIMDFSRTRPVMEECRG